MLLVMFIHPNKVLVHPRERVHAGCPENRAREKNLRAGSQVWPFIMLSFRHTTWSEVFIPILQMRILES
jgi:hypothetical protein